jgi:hypothetical protein
MEQSVFGFKDYFILEFKDKKIILIHFDNLNLQPNSFNNYNLINITSNLNRL